MKTPEEAATAALGHEPNNSIDRYAWDAAVAAVKADRAQRGDGDGTLAELADEAISSLDAVIRADEQGLINLTPYDMRQLKRAREHLSSIFRELEWGGR